MGLHTYCILPAATGRARIDGLTGIDGTPLELVAGDDVAAVVTRHDARPAAALPAIRAHNAVVAAVMTPEITPVPLRFGQWLGDDDDVRSVLGASSARWEALLDRFAGCVEFGVRIFDPAREEVTEPAGPPRTGREYMDALVKRASGAHDAQGQEALDALRQGVAGLYEDENVEPLRTPHGVASVAYLVHRRHEAAWGAALDRVRAGTPQLRFLDTGPWPPYSFAT